MSDRKAVIKNADMSEEMQQDAVDCATQVRRVFWFCFLDWPVTLPTFGLKAGLQIKVDFSAQVRGQRKSPMKTR